MKLLFIRHGDPDYSIDSLTEKGWWEAELLSRKLEKLQIRQCYVSPMGRAKDTASITLKKMGLEAIECPWLREFTPRIERPDLPGEKSLVWDWPPQEWTRFEEFYHYDRWLEHETFVNSDVPKEYRWVQEGIDGILAKHGYVKEGHLFRVVEPNNDTLVFFCHFGVQCAILGHLLGISPMVLWHNCSAAPTSITTVITEERRKGVASLRMSSFADVSHLYAYEEPPAFAERFCECFDNEDERHD